MQENFAESRAGARAMPAPRDGEKCGLKFHVAVVNAEVVVGLRARIVFESEQVICGNFKVQCNGENIFGGGLYFSRRPVGNTHSGNAYFLREATL